MCGWYSIVAPMVGLPLPLGLCGSHMSAGRSVMWSG